MPRLTLSAVLWLLLAVSWAQADQIVVHDQTFLPQNWQPDLIGQQNVSSWTVTRVPGGGVTGDSRCTHFSGSSPMYFNVVHTKLDLPWDLASRYPDLMEWELWYVYASPSNWASVGITARQGTSLYWAPNSNREPEIQGSQWQRYHGFLHATDFVRIYGSGPNQLDLSCGAPPIYWGYREYNTIPLPGNITHCVSFFNLTIDALRRSEVSPTALDFGSVPVDCSAIRSFTIRNPTPLPFTVHPTEDCAAFEIISGGGLDTLASGDSLVVSVRMTPPGEGDFSCPIDLGSSCCPDVSCSGFGETPPGPCCRPDGDCVIASYCACVDSMDGEWMGANFQCDPIHCPNSEVRGDDNSVSRVALRIPNPYIPGEAFSLDLPSATDVDIAIYDAAGRKLDEIHRGALAAGHHRFSWEARLDHGQGASGVVFIRMRVGDSILTERAVILRP